MTIQERLQLSQQLVQTRLHLLETKGKAYSGNEDSNSNFKIIAELLNLSPFQTWAVYFMKHILCILNAIKDNPDMPVDETEGLKSRIIDAQNYLDILYSLLMEYDDVKK